MTASPASVPLSFSGDSLGPFFEDHHRALAARLQTDLLSGRKGLEHDALTAAREMGAHGDASLALYPYLVPQKHGGAAVGKPPRVERHPDQPGDVPLTSADLRRSGRELGYRPRVGIDAGIQAFVRWYEETHGPES